MIPNARRVKRIVVVDPNPLDYLPLVERGSELGLSITFLRTAEQALRLTEADRVDRWLVADVPGDVSGADLCHALRGRAVKAPIYLLAERYDPQRETEALASGLAFLCKPLCTEFVDSVLAPAANPSAGRFAAA